jgi:leader peptidase (prepilin peptidase)/N-methyltransferase
MLIFASALMGLFVGSFLNVVILRVHAGKDFVKGRSACPHCHHELGPSELVPVLSWLALRGRCRHCGKPISPQYPLVEALTALVFGLSAWTLPLDTPTQILAFILWLYVAGSLIVLAVYDLRWYLLPDKILLPLIVPALAIASLYAVATGSWAVLWKPLLAAGLFGGAFYALAVVTRGKGMGGGDIKLAFIMGLLLGLQKTSLAMLIAFNVAAIVGLGLILAGRKGRGSQIPFGPFLILGTLIGSATTLSTGTLA